MSLTLVSQNKSFGGWHKQFSHTSSALNCTIRFAIYLPPQAETQALPVVYWLSGLTCTDENFMQKAGAQRVAAELGLIIVAPDTSPRGEGVPDDSEGKYDLGLGAGFYLNASQNPWALHYQMQTYITEELPALINQHFATTGKAAISGHSMGGHGALTLGFKNPQLYSAISAFSPICNPINCPWGQKAFSAYLGEDKKLWAEHDACEILKTLDTLPPVLIDQGSEDGFLAEQLKPEALIDVATKKGFALNLRMQAGYDHS
ncbi:MAG TPA: S-formylglutathione hydrolase, partial [Marinagarivorans sp.]|nr:S-formylglutathione hydrolase [Marinagarivorans sp.]